MSQIRALAAVLRGGCFGGSRWLRGCGGIQARRWIDPQRSCSSGAAPVPTVTGTSSYVEEMYFAWLEDHKNVHEVTERRRCLLISLNNCCCQCWTPTPVLFMSNRGLSICWSSNVLDFHPAIMWFPQLPSLYCVT